MKSVFIISIVAVAMIGVMVPSVFAENIFDDVKWGSNIYQNYDYDFVISYPDGWYFRENTALADVEDPNARNSSIVGFNVDSSNSKYPPNFIITYDVASESRFSYLIYSSDSEIFEWMSEGIANTGFDNIKLIDYSIERFSDGVILTSIIIFSDELSDYSGQMQDKGKYITLKKQNVLFVLDTGESYMLNYVALPSEFDSHHEDFKKSVASFMVGKNIQQPTISESITEVTSTPTCGTGTESVNGICQVIQTEEKSSGGGCLIATATYGSEMSQQVQQLREIRDNSLLNTESGTAFMSTFNDIYYSFSPIISDYERENPLFKEAIKLAITPMISSLSLMENANSESEVLSIGISVIMLNLGMYLGVPAIVIVGIRRKF